MPYTNYRKEAGVATLISGKAEFRMRKFTKDKTGKHAMIKSQFSKT